MLKEARYYYAAVNTAASFRATKLMHQHDIRLLASARLLRRLRPTVAIATSKKITPRIIAVIYYGRDTLTLLRRHGRIHIT